MRRVAIAVLRELRASAGRTLAVALLLGAGVAVYVGIYAATDSLFVTRDALYEEGRMADLEVVFVPEDAANVPDLLRIEGVAELEARLMLPGHIPLADGARLPSLLYFLDDGWPQSVNRLTLLAGHPLDPEQPEGALIERALADVHGLELGDPLEVRVGNKTYHLVVEGVVVSPEFLMTSSSGSFLIPAKGSLGVIYVSHRLMERAMGFDLVDSLALRFAPGADPGAVTARVEEALGDHVRIEELTPRANQLAYRFLKLDLEAFSQYVPAMILVFSMISILATLLTVSRLLHSRRQEIGTLMALGFSNRQLALGFTAALLIVGAIGIALGLAGAFPLRNAFMLEYAHAIGLPRVDRLMPAWRVAGGVAGGLLITLLATLVPLRRILALRPVEALRPTPGVDGTPGHTPSVRLRRLGERLLRSLPLRYAVRNLRRNAVATATTLLCMALSLAVAIAYFVSMTSLDVAIGSYLGGARWDLAVDLATPLWPEDVATVEALPGVAAVEPMVKGQVELRRPGTTTTELSTLTGVPAGAELWRYPRSAGKTVDELGADEVVLETVLARRLGLSVGDPVELVCRRRAFPAVVGGIGPGLTGESSFAPRELAGRVLDLEEMSTAAMVALEPGADPARTVAALYSLPDVAAVTARTGVAAAFRAIMAEFWSIVYVAAGLAIAVAILFIVTSLTLTVLEREGQFATMEAIGFGRATLRRILFSEAGLQMAGAVLLAIPIAWLVATYLNAQMSKVWFEAPTVGRARDFLAVLLPAIALAPVGALPGLRHVLTLDIAETVRKKTAD